MLPRNLLLAKTENKQSLSYGLVLQLIMEHLDSEGQSKAIEVIEEESGVKCNFIRFLPEIISYF
jgi:hypothetical protein